MTRRVRPKVTTTAHTQARPSDTVLRRSRKKRNSDSSTRPITRATVDATSRMTASYSAMKRGKLPAKPTRRCPAVSSAW